MTIFQDTNQTTDNKYEISNEPQCSDEIKDPKLFAVKQKILEDEQKLKEKAKLQLMPYTEIDHEPKKKEKIIPPNAGFYY